VLSRAGNYTIWLLVQWRCFNRENCTADCSFQVMISARLALAPRIATSGTVTNHLGEVWRRTLSGHAMEATTRYAFNQWSA
jgi:hypothetical protein